MRIISLVMHGTCNGRSQEVTGFVNGVALDGLEDVVCDEFLAQVADDAFGRSSIESLGLDSAKVLLVLPHIGAEGNHVETLLAQPLQDDTGIETARVGEDNLRHGSVVVGHCIRYVICELNVKIFYCEPS